MEPVPTKAKKGEGAADVTALGKKRKRATNVGVVAAGISDDVPEAKENRLKEVEGKGGKLGEDGTNTEDDTPKEEQLAEEASNKKKRKSLPTNEADEDKNTSSDDEGLKGRKGAKPSDAANKSVKPSIASDARSASPVPVAPSPALIHLLSQASTPPTPAIKVASPVAPVPASTSPTPPFTTPAWMTNKKKGPHKSRALKDAEPTRPPAHTASYAAPLPSPAVHPPQLSSSSAHLIKNIINLPPFSSGLQHQISSSTPLPLAQPVTSALTESFSSFPASITSSISSSTSLPSSPATSSPPEKSSALHTSFTTNAPSLEPTSSFSPPPAAFSSFPSSTSPPPLIPSHLVPATAATTFTMPSAIGLLASAPVWAQKMAERRAMLTKHLNDGYVQVVDYLESMMIELESEKEAATRLIALERAKIDDERRQWEEDKLRMASVQQFASNKVRLNIGGQIFETTRNTLLKDPDHMLARMFSGRFEVTRDEHDAVFIDRDASVFGLVLNFLRSDELSVSPREEGTLWKLLEEAKFYQIQSLVDCVKDKLGMRYVWYADWQHVCNSTEKFYQSPIFIVGGWPWRLSLVRDEGWLGISLTVSKRARQLPKGWRMNASFAVDIKNIDPKKVSASMQHSDAQLDEARTGIFWRHCYELEKLALDGVIADDKLIISAEIKIESCTLLD